MPVNPELPALCNTAKCSAVCNAMRLLDIVHTAAVAAWHPVASNHIAMGDCRYHSLDCKSLACMADDLAQLHQSVFLVSVYRMACSEHTRAESVGWQAWSCQAGSA